MNDVFQPRNEPARSIYDAFQNEATKRKCRSVDEWVKAERDAVFREATHQAQKLGLRVPTMDEVAAAERSAMGHVDYGAKWAYRVTEAMNSSNLQGQRDDAALCGGSAAPQSSASDATEKGQGNV